MNQTTISAPAGSSERLPLGSLLALAMAAFITLLTEIMPAGVLSSIAGDLKVSESGGAVHHRLCGGGVGRRHSAHRIDAGHAAPPLLLSAICGFAIVNLVTALSHDYHVSLATRFFAGVFGGIVWSLLAGYAVRMSPAHLGGRAIAISGAGATGAGARRTARHVAWPSHRLAGRLWPDDVDGGDARGVDHRHRAGFPRPAKAHRPSLSGVFLQCGIRAVLFVVFTFIVAHNILYIYRAFPHAVGVIRAGRYRAVYLWAGAIAGLGVAGMLVDRRVHLLR